MYSCRRPEWQQIYITAIFIKIAVTSNTNVFLPQSRPAADLYHNAVNYNCSNKQHKRIRAAFQTGSRSISKRSALQLQWQASETYSCCRPDQQQIYITSQCITFAVTSNTNVFLPPSRPAVFLYQSAVRFNCSYKQQKRIAAAVQTSSRSISQRTVLKLQ